jgi:hypothetical protein
MQKNKQKYLKFQKQAKISKIPKNKQKYLKRKNQVRISKTKK